MRLDLAGGWSVVSSRTGDVEATAASELDGALQRLTGRGGGRGRLRIELDHAGDVDDEAFGWTVGLDAVRLEGGGPRGLLYAVYDFLEALGFRWPGPGIERRPEAGAVEIPDAQVSRGPGLEGRCLIIGSTAFVPRLDEWLTWAARNRLNTLFLHIEPPRGGGTGIGSMPFAAWEGIRPRVVELARRFGFVLELGGHGLSDLLPRTQFESDPDAFRMVNGERTPNRNLCPSSASARRTIAEAATAWFRAHPEVDVFHLWPDDLPGGGWCQCPACAELSPSDQSLLATNALADALAQVAPEAQIAHLAYHDTQGSPTVPPRPNVSLLWAPRRRCYAHAADDRSCPVNDPEFGAGFRDVVAGFGPGVVRPPRVFEYYLDEILFKSVVPPFPAILGATLAFYAEAGVHTVQALLVGPRDFASPSIDGWLFARLAWDPGADVDRLIADFAEAVFGPGTAGPTGMPAYYRALEAAYAAVLDLRPDQVLDAAAMAEGMTGDVMSYIVEYGLVDMEDPLAAPLPRLRQLASGLGAVPALLDEAAKVVAAAGPTDAARAETAELDLARAWLGFAAARVDLYASLLDDSGRDGIEAAHGRALAAYERVVAWAHEHLPPDQAAAMEFLHWMAWKATLNRVRLEHLTPPEERDAAQAERRAEAGRQFQSLMSAGP